MEQKRQYAPRARPRRKFKKRTKRKRGPSSALVEGASISDAAGYNLYRSVPNTPLPMKLKVNFTYGTRFVLNVGVGGIPATHIFSANGLYDPDITGVGHQPRGFDELMALYDHFVVIGSKITMMTSANRYTDTGGFAIVLKDGTSTTIDPDDILEEAYVCYRLGTPGGEPVNLVQKFSNHFLGYSKPLGVDELEGNVSTNPAEQAYYHCTTWSPAGTDEAAINCVARIEYTAMLIEPNLPNKS